MKKSVVRIIFFALLVVNTISGAATMPSSFLVNTASSPVLGTYQRNSKAVQSRPVSRFKLVVKSMLARQKGENAYNFNDAELRLFRQSKLAGILGMGSVILLFLPFIGFLAPFAAIAGIVLGIVSIGKYKKLPEARGKTMAILGIAGGGLSLLLMLAAVIVIASIWL